MKKKKTAPPIQKQQASAMEPTASPVPDQNSPLPVDCAPVSLANRLPGKEVFLLIAFGILFLLGTTVTSGKATLVGCVLLLVFTIRKNPFRDFREHFCLPAVSFFFLMLMFGAASLYSSDGDISITEFYKYLAVGSLMGIAFMRFRKEHVRGLIWIFVAVSSFLALITIDGGSSMILLKGFRWVLENVFKVGYGFSFGSVTSRLNGVYNNANVIASIFALAMILAIHLVFTAKSRLQRFLASVLLGLNAVTFLLCVSRGALLCFAVSMLVYLAAMGKEQRIQLFLLMLNSAVATLVCSVLSTTIAPASALPVLLSLLCGVIIFLLDAWLAFPLGRFLAGKGKLIIMCVGALAAVCVVFLIAAVNVTGPMTMHADELVIRSLSLKPGTYTVDGDWDGEYRVQIVVEGQEDLLLDRGETVYDGPLTAGATVTIPDDAVTIQALLTCTSDGELRNVQFSDGTQIKLRYKFLPAALAERIQDNLLTSSSLLLRIQYDIDAFKVFLASPLIGRGLGSTESWFTSVQPIYYESMYAHNHILQFLADVGLLGLLFFLIFMGGAAYYVWKHLREDRNSLNAAFLAGLVMMNLHGLMEISFSLRGYMMFAYLFVGMILIEYGGTMPAYQAREKMVKRGTAIVCCGLWLYTLVFGGLLLSTRTIQKRSASFETKSFTEFMDTLHTFIEFDRYKYDYHMMTYIGNAVGKSEYSSDMYRYVKRLRNAGTYEACSGLTKFYYLPSGQLEEMFVVSREGIAQKASDKRAWNGQFEFYRNVVLPTISPKYLDIYLEGVLGTRDYLAEYSEGRLEEIELTEENQAFLKAVEQVWKTGMDSEEAYEYLSTFVQLEEVAE